ncbi:xylose isomerase-like protein [Hyaloscypha variabilis F]|uniref:Xylose isomerase-like protein n=1 Tax=Hyaloscypha variabilis (strain UAMH 11265 / GT02V1 / F) TaxID=1149755 RepID=A0A2J6QSG8_HYAVF|nr:xylose isomerase-like protein [Hyaloscypha variabilis F]
MPFQPAIASPSLGHASVHPIQVKLEQAAAHGFKLIEIVEEDLNMYSRSLEGGLTDSNKIRAAEFVRGFADTKGLQVAVLQPFWFYDGLLDRKEHEAMIAKLRLWMRLVKILGTQLVQIPSNWLVEGTTGDMDIIVKDLVEMADIGLEQDPVVSFAYEGVAWGTHIDTWQGSWEVVKRVNKPNFGLCLDTFHIAARVWGDPTASSGKNPNADIQLNNSMKQLVEEVDVRKVFYVQVGDAERLEQPLLPGHPFHVEGQLPRMSWSRNARLFAFEEGRGGCLPVALVIDAIINKLNFRGLLTLEVFSRELLENDASVPNNFAARGMKSWKSMIEMID